MTGRAAAAPRPRVRTLAGSEGLGVESTTPDAASPDSFELSFAEELLWTAGRPHASPPPFIDCPPTLSMAARLRGVLTRAALDTALTEIVRRHEVLRCVFRERAGRPLHVCAAPAPAGVATIDLRSVPGAVHERVVDGVLAAQTLRSFTPADGPRWRAILIVLSDREHVLAISIDHVVFDSWSKRVLAHELRSAYEDSMAGQPSRLPPLRRRYRDYVRRQRRRLTGDRGRALVEYWTARLRALGDDALPADWPRRADSSLEAGICSFTLSARETDRLRVVSREHRLTVATTLLAITHLFLHQASGADDIAIGVPVSDRRREEDEPVIGLFANLVIVRAAIARGATFPQLLRAVEASLNDAYLHQEMPYGHLAQLLSGRPLYRTVFNFISSVPASGIALPGLQATPLPARGRPRSLADASLHVQPRGDALACRFVYKAALFSADRVRRWADHYQALVTAVANAPTAPLSAFADPRVGFATARPPR